MSQEKIDPARLVPMDIFARDLPLRVDLSYAGPGSFCGVIYRPGARLWLHEDLAGVVLLASCLCRRDHGLAYVLYDGLRTVTAQALMIETDIVKAHPHWLEGDGRVLSSPGQGGHPRAMAIDIGLERESGALTDMGTGFDEMPEGGTGPETNRAHRLYQGLTEDIKANRRKLEDTMVRAAALLHVPLLPLPVEWWDFRIPSDLTRRYAPLDDRDLPPQMRMTDKYLTAGGPADFAPGHFERQRDRLLKIISQFL
jgi:zinc D-Ala-D-Ala dipeptidase